MSGCSNRAQAELGGCDRRPRGSLYKTGTPEYLRSDNGSEFRDRIVREWLETIGVTTLFIAPGSPWENGYVEPFIGKLRDELLNGEIFYTLIEAQVLIGR